MNGLLRVLWKEMLQLLRDRQMIPALIIGPLVQLLALGYAANTDVNDIPLLLVDLDRTPASRDLAERFTSSGYFRLAGAEDSVRGVDPWLVDGRAQVALVIGSGYGEAVAAGRAPDLQVLADGTDSNSAVLGLGYASRILAGEALVRMQRLARTLAEQAARAGGAPPIVGRDGPGRIELAPRVWYNPDLKSRWFYVPAILAMTLMLTSMILPSMAVVREKEIGTLEQIIVTPVRPWQLIVGKLLPFFFIGLINLALVTLLVLALFHVPLRGGFFALALLTVPFLLTLLGLGMFASTAVANQQQAMMSSIFLLMVPMIYLSGLIFPIENMPHAIQKATYAIPVRYYVIIIRGVFLKGDGLATLWPETAILSGFAAASLGLAALRFRKRLD